MHREKLLIRRSRRIIFQHRTASGGTPVLQAAHKRNGIYYTKCGYILHSALQESFESEIVEVSRKGISGYEMGIYLKFTRIKYMHR